LAGLSQTCVYQHIQYLTPGYYNLTYQYVTDASINYNSNKFGVYLDEVKLDSVTPTDYIIHTRTIQIVRTILINSSRVAFCGEATNSTTKMSGASIIYVYFIRTGDLPVNTTNTSNTSNTANLTNSTVNSTIN
jgi:hypothetical protein